MTLKIGASFILHPRTLSCLTLSPYSAEFIGKTHNFTVTKISIDFYVLNHFNLIVLTSCWVIFLFLQNCIVVDKNYPWILPVCGQYPICYYWHAYSSVRFIEGVYDFTLWWKNSWKKYFIRVWLIFKLRRFKVKLSLRH